MVSAVADSPSLPITNLRHVLRAADALRRLEPVVLNGENGPYILLPLERLSALGIAELEALGGEKTLLITGNRAEVMHIGSKGWPAVELLWPSYAAPAELEALGDPTRDLDMPLKGPFRRTDRTPTGQDDAALKLLKIARLLPGAVCVKDVDPALCQDMLGADTEAVLGFDLAEAESLREVARARVPLKDSENTMVVSFRSASGGTEHLALMIGDVDPSKPVLSRLHSECYTGDLIGSLKCDCGDQLRGAIKAMAEEGSGILLYLAQEGRGIGLNAKLKAYHLQDQGYDTVDANIRLGFDVDERLFMPAATMLRALGCSDVRLMTNNPEKVAGLERSGITVTERVQHAFETNDHNRSYLATKVARTGHIIHD